ncbi:alpha/beta hydrolase [Dactylosporangium sp. AC04546]|uniref:alpha/beta fold hydrolase n=1 Tax=Dactylosporangium sp. AC04546 TaxID=2862460 RepID=UPI001EDFD555|nr:alpha/beta hydrolase [Dactylosporangium sp. AC04546]WVK83541.1 alpha/beta hydrolase [Dactylosporangium sp. AC04546]
MQTEYEIIVDNERLLTVEVSGAPDGAPVFLLHGTPGSRSGPKPRSSVLYRLGVKLVTYDRPGYGGSTRVPGRSVAHAAHDVALIADRLNLGRFSVVGRSGGGPHALACAALLPDRVTRAAVLVGLAPADANGLEWFDGMAEDNVRKHSAAAEDAVGLMRELVEQAERVAVDPESLIEVLRSQMSPPDQRFMQSVMYRRLFSASYREALRSGPYGWIDDVLAFRGDWGFALDDIPGVVHLWHGAQDTFSPVGHSLWIASQLRRAEVQVEDDGAHFTAVEVLPRVLTWLTAA